MTDLSKIDFTQLKLEPIDSMKVDIELRAHISIALNGWIAARRDVNDWAITSGSNGLVKRQVDELWKRAEQVDEFIKEQSRRNVTILEMVMELVDSNREIDVAQNGTKLSYRFNRNDCSLECYSLTLKEWVKCARIGNYDDTVTILD